MKALFSLLAAMLLPRVIASDCDFSLLSTGDLSTGEVRFNTDPHLPIDQSRISFLNQTIREEWYFDATSLDGTSQMIVRFARDPSGPAGPLYVGIDALWPNSTQASYNIPVENTTIISCPDNITGIWESSSKFTNITFFIGASRHATIDIDTPDLKASLSMNANTPTVYPSGALYPDPNATLEFAPYVWWLEAIPTAPVDVTATFNGTSFNFSGIGGHDYFLTAFASWAYTCKNWTRARLVIGPYSAVTWQFTSSITSQLYTSAVLFQDGIEVFSSLESAPSAALGKYLNITSVQNNGGFHGPFDDSTGFGLEFVDPSMPEGGWYFETKHQNIGLTFDDKSEDGSEIKFERYADSVRGGVKGLPQVFSGAGISEQMLITGNPSLPAHGKF